MIEVIAQPKFSHKRIGYLVRFPANYNFFPVFASIGLQFVFFLPRLISPQAATQCFNEKTDVIILVTSSIRKVPPPSSLPGSPSFSSSPFSSNSLFHCLLLSFSTLFSSRYPDTSFSSDLLSLLLFSLSSPSVLSLLPFSPPPSSSSLSCLPFPPPFRLLSLLPFPFLAER